MATAERQSDPWSSVLTDLLLSLVGFAIVLTPAITVGNDVLGSPLDPTATNLLTFVLALFGANAVVAGYSSLGDLGEYLFVLVAAAFGWGAVGMVSVIVLGIELSGSNPFPQAVLWTAAYLTAALVVFRSDVSVVG